MSRCSTKLLKTNTRKSSTGTWRQTCTLYKSFCGRKRISSAQALLNRHPRCSKGSCWQTSCCRPYNSWHSIGCYWASEVGAGVAYLSGSSFRPKNKKLPQLINFRKLSNQIIETFPSVPSAHLARQSLWTLVQHLCVMHISLFRFCNSCHDFAKYRSSLKYIFSAIYCIDH